MLREIFQVWNEFTFEELLVKIQRDKTFLMDAIISGNVIRKFVESDFYIQVKKRKINGSSVQNIKRVYEGEDLNIPSRCRKNFTKH